MVGKKISLVFFCKLSLLFIKVLLSFLVVVAVAV